MAGRKLARVAERFGSYTEAFALATELWMRALRPTANPSSSKSLIAGNRGEGNMLTAWNQQAIVFGCIGAFIGLIGGQISWFAGYRLF